MATKLWMANIVIRLLSLSLIETSLHNTIVTLGEPRVCFDKKRDHKIFKVDR
jgi:hypothetical protein